MSHKPIIFNTEMVRAILDGRKTQTRRVVKMPFKEMHDYQHGSFSCNGLEWFYSAPRVLGNPANGDVVYETAAKIKCPYGQVGDTLWVRETFSMFWGQWTEYGWEYDSDDGRRLGKEMPDAKFQLVHKASWDGDIEYEYWRPSIFMPKWASRITLKITDVRVERLKDIRPRDAASEGVSAEYPDGGEAPKSFNYVEAFRGLWDSINAKRGYSWESNPYVWVVEFEVQE
jgi:hypothetical protein